jgi:hypothetical protein
MKKQEDSFNEIHFAENPEPQLKKGLTGICARFGKHVKVFGYMVIFTGIGLAFTSCAGGYVASEPTYHEYSRPPRPSETHIWISGDWGWNNQTQVYVQKMGYWEKPRQNQIYVEGYWQTSPNGKSWSKGHWQKDNHSHSGHHDNGNH